MHASAGDSGSTSVRRSLGWAFGIATVGIAAGLGYWAGLRSSPPPGLIERPVLQATPAEQRAGVAPPPFFIKGTVLSPGSRLAHVAVLDDAQREKLVHQVREGETLEGYRLAQIENHRVYFEREGVVFFLPVGGSKSAAEPPMPAEARLLVPQQKERTAVFVPPPDNIGEIRQDLDSFVERLRQDPGLRKRLEQKKRERLEQQEAEGANR